MRITERLLSLFSQVRAGEARPALLLACNVFVLLTAYYVIKPVREALILAGGGAEVKSYASAGQALLLAGAVPLYGLLAGRFPRRALITGVTLFFAACLVVFYLLARAGVAVGVPFFLWVGVFNLMVIAQFWAFANDLYSPEEGKRLFPIVGFGASLGAVSGSAIAGALVRPLGVEQLLLVAGGLLVVSLLITFAAESAQRTQRRRQHELERSPGRVDGRADGRADGSAETPATSLPSEDASPLGSRNPFALVLGSRYLLGIALLVLLLNWVNTTGEYILGKTVAQAAAAAATDAPGLRERDLIGAFYADFQFWTSVLSVVLQLFVVSRVLRWFGVRGALLVLPTLSLIGYSCLAFLPVLGVIRWVKTAENATDYSLQNTVRNVLFLPTTREEKYKAKQAIDSFFVRMGDVLSAGLVFAGTTWLALAPQQFALFNLALVVVWLGLAVLVGRENHRRIASR